MPLEPVKVTFVLYRHEETYHNRAGVISGGSSNPQLTPEGEARAKEVGELITQHFPVLDAHYCSDLDRAYNTAKITLGNRRPLSL